jgi:GDP-mannose 6-dehydrogenase
MNVSVFGLGYVGTVTAACLAKAGHRVIGVDSNADKVALVRAGRSPIVEAGLGELLKEVTFDGSLTATTDARAAAAATDAALVCVGTPGVSTGRPDVDAIDRVGRDIGAAIASRNGAPFTVILRSTVLPGTTERVLIPALKSSVGRADAFRVAVNPEFMREGTSIADFDAPPFVLIGADDPAAGAVVRELYASVDAQVIEAPIRTAELVKFASNAFHAVKICFANEMGDIASALGADGGEVMRIFAQDKKLNVSEAYLRPGYAFGGSCLPKDVRALLWAARTNEVSAPLLSSVWPSNVNQIQTSIDRVLATRCRHVSVAGLAFKPGTDDLRESPVVTLVEALIGKGLDVRVLDRNVSIARLTGANRQYIENEIPHIASILCDSPEELAEHAEVLVVGSANDDAAAALARVKPGCAVIDLTRRGLDRAVRAGDEQTVCVPAH